MWGSLDSWKWPEEAAEKEGTIVVCVFFVKTPTQQQQNNIIKNINIKNYNNNSAIGTSGRRSSRSSFRWLTGNKSLVKIPQLHPTNLI